MAEGSAISCQNIQACGFNKYIVKDFTLKDQLKSASISISDNIAEGFEYNNNPDFYRFLRIAKGSCGEIRNKVLFYSENAIYR